MDTPSMAGLDPMQQFLLAQLAGDPVPAAPSMEDLIAQVPEDPMTAAVLEALRKRREREALAPDNETDFGTDLGHNEVGQPGGVGPDPEVADVLQRLYDEVAVLRARTETLADALGACATCWGSDPRCPTCRGRGAPGGRLPVKGPFTMYVTPAVDRCRARSDSRGATPETDGRLGRSSDGSFASVI